MFAHVRRKLAISGASNAPWLVGCRLVCTAALFVPALHAQTNSPAPTVPHSSRYLLIVETSRPMQRRTQGTLDPVRNLLGSCMGAQARRGDTLRGSTFHHPPYARSISLH